LSKRSSNDAYYTKPEVAARLSAIILSMFKGRVFLEPSAGSGSFSRCIPTCLAYDTHPAYDGVIKQDFFNVTTELKDSVVFGNPPFGKNSSIAVKFFNHAANNHCHAICFVLPRTFQKESIQDRLNSSFHLMFEELLEKNSFLLDDKEYDVPCVFQIWVKKEIKRDTHVKHDCGLFTQVDCVKDADICVRRVGGRSGKIIPKEKATKSTTYFLKSDNINELTQRLELCENALVECSKQTAGVRSLSINELHKILGAYL
jgi:hypothetical protein